jgi:hypothetical protein
MDLEEHGGWADGTAVVGEFGKVAKQSFFLGGKNGGSRFIIDWREERAVAASRAVTSLALAWQRAEPTIF